MKQFADFPKMALEQLASVESEISHIEFRREQMFTFQVAVGNFSKLFDRLGSLIQSSEFQKLVHESKAGFRTHSDAAFASMAEASQYLQQLQQETELMEAEAASFESLLCRIEEFERRKLLATEKRERFTAFYEDVMQRQELMENTPPDVLADIHQYDAAETIMDQRLSERNDRYATIIESLSERTRSLLQECAQKEQLIGNYKTDLTQYGRKLQELSAQEQELLAILSLYTAANETIINQFGEMSTHAARARLRDIQAELEQIDSFMRETVQLNEQVRAHNRTARTPGTLP